MDNRNSPTPPIDADLGAAFALASSAWPTLDLPLDDFAAFLGSHGVRLAATGSPIIQDLFLACACARNIPGALRCFGDRFSSVVSLAAARFDDSPAFIDEVYQRLCETLFVVGPNGPAKIGQYTGQGPLAGFVSTTARRIALRMRATAERFQGEEALVQQFSEIHEEETAMLKLRHREVFNRALSTALRQLPSRERLILRLNLVEHVSTTRIADMYKVSQPTVSRWIQRAAHEIFAMVKDLVCDELDIDTRELESLLLLVRSQIEITLSQATASSVDSSR